MKMTISLEKLTKMIDKCDFYIKNYYGNKRGKCMYIEIVSKKSGNSFLLHIPSKYDIILNGVRWYELKEIDDIMTVKDVTHEYGSKESNRKFEEMYSMINIQDTVDENVLNNNYKRELDYTDIKSKYNENVKCIYRQVNRLKFSVESLKYKIGIIYNSYMCVITKRNEVRYYYIKNFDNKSVSKKFILTFDLELLYEKSYDIHGELNELKQSMFSLLNKNLNINIKYTTKMINDNINISRLESIIKSKKTKLDGKYNEYNRLLDACLVKEQIIRDSISKNGKTQSNTVQLKDILKTKGGIILDIINVIDKRDDFLLLCDNVMYDNVIMYDKISKNLKLLNDL